MSHWKSAFTLLFVLLAAGCASKPEPLAPALTDQVREGMSRTEVRRNLGRPTRALVGANGKRTEIYFANWNPDRSEIGRYAPMATYRARTFSVLYGPNETVEQTRTYDTSGSVRRIHGIDANPQISAGYQITPQDLAEIKAGETTRAVLVRRFEEPLVEALSPLGEVVCWWVAFTGEAKLFSVKKDERVLRVVLNPDQTVKEFGMEERLERDEN